MRMRLVIPAVVFALSLGVAPSVGATPPTQATATYSTLLSPPTLTVIRTADGNTTYAVVDSFVWTGGISGTAADTATASCDATAFGSRLGSARSPSDSERLLLGGTH